MGFMRRPSRKPAAEREPFRHKRKKQPFRYKRRKPSVALSGRPDPAVPADPVVLLLLRDLQEVWFEHKCGDRTEKDVRECEEMIYGLLIEYLATMETEEWLEERARRLCEEENLK